ncbi:hypothetical protein MICH65_0834 [Candidatus Chazhemtobacterium aquaticus]|uniref:Uncharacterized protein n=1 Tax=Candidatus Chazhemtobacterium aquaticus TaxID=2715735 RepID=A0A857N6B3_9BACT|nr:hypothetical protein MICH65_0834 [Candidatus Chazhemtobacterium aquaticus]
MVWVSDKSLKMKKRAMIGVKCFWLGGLALGGRLKRVVLEGFWGFIFRLIGV